MRIQTSLRGERIGLFAMDPGSTTGVAYGEFTVDGTAKDIFDRDLLTVDEILCYDRLAKPILAEVAGASEIASLYITQKHSWLLNGISTKFHFFVYEDFVLAPGSHSSKREGLSPVRVTSLIQGMLVTDQINWIAQSPATAKSTVTNERLRRWDLWTRGMVHGRDATKHAATFVRNAT